jgi:hypothetical protein
MTATVVELQGTLRPDGTLVLDTKPDLPPGRVRVTVQALEAGADVIEVLQRIHEEQAASGHVPRTREQIDSDIAAMRQEGDQNLSAAGTPALPSAPASP